MATQCLVAQRRPRTYFRHPVNFLAITFSNPSTFNAEQTLALRNRCGAKRAILQNKPNLQKCETNRNLCPERTYETTTTHNSRKNKPNFQARRQAERRPRTYFHYRVSFSPITLSNPYTLNPEQALVLRSWCGTKRTILQNKPNLQKIKTNLISCLKMTYEKIPSATNPKTNPIQSQFIPKSKPKKSQSHPNRTSGPAKIQKVCKFRLSRHNAGLDWFSDRRVWDNGNQRFKVKTGYSVPCGEAKVPDGKRYACPGGHGNGLRDLWDI